MRRLIATLPTSPVEAIALILLAAVLAGGVLSGSQARELPPIGRIGAP